MQEREHVLLTALLEHLPDAVYVKDTQSRFVLVNRTMARMFHLPSPEAALGKTDFDFFTREHAQQAFDDEKEIMASGRPIVGKEEKETWPDGRITWASSTKLPLYGEGGRLVGTFGVSRDITAQKEAEESLVRSERRYRELLSTTPSYTYTVYLQEDRPVSTDHSAGCLAVTGYAASEYTRDPYLWITMVHPEDQRRVIDTVRRELGQPNAQPIEHRIVRKDGQVRWILNTMIRHFNSSGQLVRYDGLVEDITERKEAELALRQAHDEMEARVRQRTAELARANAELTAAVARLKQHDRAKSEFVSAVSHDLKSPLASMTYLIGNLLSGIPCSLPEAGQSYLKMLQAECRRLDRTINDILDMGQIEAGTLMLRRAHFAIGPLVQWTVEQAGIPAQAKHQSLSVRVPADPGVVDGDAEKLQRALRNVVDNAIKFTPNGGAVTVTVDFVRAARPPTAAPAGTHAEAEAVIRVDDTGIGIPSEHLARISDRYFRVNQNIAGTGLGLAICREIVSLHGGRLEIASPPPGVSAGTRVSIVLPLVADASAWAAGAA